MLHYDGAKMTLEQLRKLRYDLKVSLLDIAARTGLPEEYLEKIEEEKVPALESDLERIKRAILQAAKEMTEPDDDSENA